MKWGYVPDTYAVYMFSSPSHLVPQLTVHVGKTASVLDVIAVGVAPAYAKAARETVASVIPILANVPTRGKPSCCK